MTILNMTMISMIAFKVEPSVATSRATGGFLFIGGFMDGTPAMDGKFGQGYNLNKVMYQMNQPDDNSVCCGHCGQAPLDCTCEEFVCSGGYTKILDMVEYKEDCQ